MVGERDEMDWRGEEMSHYSATNSCVPMGSSGCVVIGRWTWRQLASCPMHWGTTEHVFHRPSICERVVPSHPCFVPWFTVHFQTLDIERSIAIATSCSNFQTLSITKTDSHRLEPRRKNKEGGLSCHWI
jgi:dihydrofolate reductase